MSDLENTDELSVQLGAPSDDVIVMHPEEGRKMDVWTQNEDVDLFTDRDEFIKAGTSERTVTLSQENDFDKGAIQLTNTLKKELGNPDTVKLFLKTNNLFIKPL